LASVSFGFVLVRVQVPRYLRLLDIAGACSYGAHREFGNGMVHGRIYYRHDFFMAFQ